ncbi:MAG: LCP family protein [Clostridium sp.]
MASNRNMPPRKNNNSMKNTGHTKSTNQRKKKSKKRKRKNILKIFLVCFLLLIILFIFTIISLVTAISSVDTIDFPKSNTSLGIGSLSTEQLNDDIINIALFGLDRRTPEEPCRSDSMIIVSLDTVHKKLKLSSLMRDTYVDIPGHGYDKLTHAYFYGGPELAVKTINQNFNLNIKNYISIDFIGMQDIINKIGGIELELADNELEYMNDYITEQSELRDVAPEYLKSPGSQHVTGMQALAFTRVRYTSSGDFGRSSRQRIVMDAMITKIKKNGILKFPSTVNKLIPSVATSLNGTDIFKLASKAFLSDSIHLQQARFPTDGNWYDLDVNGVYYMGHTEEDTKREIFNYIYNDFTPELQLEDIKK